MNKNVSVSIIIPIYNVEKWLFRCLKSIQNQTFKDFEVLLIDDGSPDQSYKICQNFVKNDTRFKYFKKNNGGLSDARNYGLNYISGKYVVFIDSDDFVEKTYLEKLFNAIKKHNAEVALCSCNFNKEDGEVTKSIFFATKENVIDGRTLLKNVFKKGEGLAYTVVWNKMYDVKIFNKIKFAKGKLYEDEFFNPATYWNIKKIVIINEPLYNYVQRDESIIKSKMNVKKVLDAREALTKRIMFYDGRDNELYNMAVKYYCNWIINFYYNNYQFLKGNKSIDLKLQNDFRRYSKYNNLKGLKQNIKKGLGCVNLKILSFFKEYI